ncbi:UNVERIFIED_CONTAM: hypothetical protein FKN15_039787 [Acipenser sinensis]
MAEPQAVQPTPQPEMPADQGEPVQPIPQPGTATDHVEKARLQITWKKCRQPLPHTKLLPNTNTGEECVVHENSKEKEFITGKKRKKNNTNIIETLEGEEKLERGSEAVSEASRSSSSEPQPGEMTTLRSGRSTVLRLNSALQWIAQKLTPSRNSD